MAAMDDPENAKPIGAARIEDFTWKAILDFYTCTECGRCSDHCPAHRTGKILSPKQFTIDLRDHLYEREHEFLNRDGGPKGAADGHHGDDHGDDHADEHGDDENAHDDHAHDDHGHDDHDHHEPVYPDNPAPIKAVHSEPIDLIGNVIHPDVLWACTTCRACEEQCPVMISYVDKIVEMRRNLVTIKGEFPAELNGPFNGMMSNGNPWNMSAMDRANWAEGLDLTMMAEYPEAPVLFWVGCAASYDDRAKKIARSTAKLLKAAGVDFAILGQEESCTGDPARRAGHEHLFATMAEQNIATMNGYKEQGGIKTIVTSCPHCFNTIANEYPDFDGHYEVVHHTDYLLGLVAEKKLFPRQRVDGRVVFHDSCYLGRLQRGVRAAARHLEQHSWRRARRGRGGVATEGALLRCGWHADVHGGTEQGPHERSPYAAAPRYRGDDHRHRVPVLHHHDHRWAEGSEQGRLDSYARCCRAPRRELRARPTDWGARGDASGPADAFASSGYGAGRAGGVSVVFGPIPDPACVG